MARTIPVLLVDEFGVDDALLNQVFEGSGCLGGLKALETADFRHPAPRWLLDNYFHSTAENTWIPMLDELVAAARAGELPPDRGRASTRAAAAAGAAGTAGASRRSAAPSRGAASACGSGRRGAPRRPAGDLARRGGSARASGPAGAGEQCGSGCDRLAAGNSACPVDRGTGTTF